MSKVRSEIEETVKQILQEFVGDSRVILLSDKPISGLGLTSLDGVDFACELEKRLGCSIPSKVNPFVVAEDDKALCERDVTQIVNVVFALCS